MTEEKKREAKMAILAIKQALDRYDLEVVERRDIGPSEWEQSELQREVEYNLKKLTD